MNFKKFLVAALPAMLLASCASDEPTVGPGADDTGGKAMYAKIQIKVPSTRSSTINPDENTNSNSGYEIGQPYENDINDVTIVLATYDETTQKYTPVADGTSAMPDTSQDNVYTIMFKDDDIVKLAEKQVYIFAYCNVLEGNRTFTTPVDLETQTTAISSASAGQGIWKSSHFMMVNAPNRDGIPTSDHPAVPSVSLPDVTALTNNYNSAEKALNLGTVDVARTAARFDYKVVNENKYAIYDVNDTETDRTPLANVEMVAMVPFNIAKEFYTLPRVSADGTGTGWMLCGNEVVTPAANYVVSPFFTEKKSGVVSNYFSQLSLDTNYENYGDWTIINDWYNNNGTVEDDDNNWVLDPNNGNETAADRQGYKIWRYVTENTLPGVEAQIKGNTTGIIFKAKITPVEGSTTLLSEALRNHKTIYFYHGTCYGDIVNLRRVVANMNPEATMYKEFVAVFGEDFVKYEVNPDTGLREYKTADDALTDCTSNANVITENGAEKHVFKILRPDNDGNYFTYYVYYNRHNDNNQPTVMAPMEFATVRNNVYKLSVTTVTDFGHTNDPKDDPEPENPPTPDETPKTYFKVSCRVLPWVVRVNNIEF